MNSFATILSGIITLAFAILDKLDASRATELRNRIAGDAVGLLVEKLGGKQGTIVAHSDIGTNSDTGRTQRSVD